jgi:hypothetical protein
MKFITINYNLPMLGLLCEEVLDNMVHESIIANSTTSISLEDGVENESNGNNVYSNEVIGLNGSSNNNDNINENSNPTILLNIQMKISITDIKH